MNGIGERQFRRYFAVANRTKGVTGEELLRLLETRLDAVAHRMGWSLSLRQAPQLVSPGRGGADGRRVDVPSFGARPGQELETSTRRPSTRTWPCEKS